MQRTLRRIGLGLWLCAAGVASASAADNADEVVQRLLAAPVIEAAPGFAASVLVPPGRLFDPLVMLPVGDAVWLNDDGGEEHDKGSRLLSLDPAGTITILAGIGKLLPTVGYDLAPEGFGGFGGQIFTLTQPRVAMDGALASHLIQRVDPAHDYASSTVCQLPDAGGKKIAGFGLDARFGPRGSPFEGRLFSVTIYNDTIYQTTADGTCTPFVVFDGKRYSAPAMLRFAADGQSMLVSVSRGAFDINSTAPQAGAIVRVSPSGRVEDQPVFEGSGRPMGMDFAPVGFGAYGGQLFFADIGIFQVPVPMTQALNADGKIYRLTAQGKPELVAAGFHNPIGVRFVGNELWVTDINGDFIAGKRELPDGFVVKLEAH